MIRINLLAEKSKGKKGKRGGPPAPIMTTGMPAGGPNIFLMAGICLAVAGALLWTQYNGYQEDAKRIATRIQQEQEKSKKLEEVAVKYDQAKKEADQYERQVKVIDGLRSAQQGPVKLLSKLSDVVNSTDAIWLNNMAESGDNVSMDGVALSTIAIANLITNLSNSGYFTSVELKDATEDPGSKFHQFSFSITCAKVQAKKT